MVLSLGERRYAILPNLIGNRVGSESERHLILTTESNVLPPELLP
jgi:hypothetical protein